MYVCKEKTAVLSQQGWFCRMQKLDNITEHFIMVWNKLYIFCISKSKIEAAFRDKSQKSAVNTTFPFVDSAKVGNNSMHIPAFPSLNNLSDEQRKKEETSTRR